MKAITVCLYLLGHFDAYTPARMDSCVRAGIYAEYRGVDVELVAALGWHESRWIGDRVSRAGAVGPLQVITRYCRVEDVIHCGVEQLRHHLRRIDAVESVCRYNSGRVCKESSLPWSRNVVYLSNYLKRKLD